MIPGRGASRTHDTRQGGCRAPLRETPEARWALRGLPTPGCLGSHACMVPAMNPGGLGMIPDMDPGCLGHACMIPDMSPGC